MRFFPSRKGQPLPGPLEGLRTLLWNKFYVDEGYQLLIIRPVSMVARILWRVVDSILIDGVAVKGTAWVTKQSGSVLRYLQTGDAQAYAAIMALGLAGALVWILQRYAL
jgi:NADH-quinone oxidoreductase subunit L